MCGIVAVVRRRTLRATPKSSDVLDFMTQAAGRVPPIDSVDAASLKAVAESLHHVDDLLSGEAGLLALLGDADLASGILFNLDQLNAHIGEIERHLDELNLEAPDSEMASLESINSALIEVKDAAWAVERDRLRNAAAVAGLGAVAARPAGAAVYLSIQQALSSLDRLEVRGRDSAGIHILVWGHGLDLQSRELKAMLAKRGDDVLFTDGAVRVHDGILSFVYKAAAEIGELGDNTAAMRAAIAADDLLKLALASPDAEATVLGHTRWASVGIISEPNAHPVNSDEADNSTGPYVLATLNGDVDNFADLIAAESLKIPIEITTDAKVIPTMVSRSIAAGHNLDESVRRTVAQFEGSVAIGLSTGHAPQDIHLALRGSGQGVFVGEAEDAFVVASEPYGVVEEAHSYLRMDGETPADEANPTTSQGQIIRIHGSVAGERGGVTRYAYDGTPLPIAEGEWKAPSVTTRDIDRGDSPHFLLKEINESPVSFRKTLRGRLVESATGLAVKLPPETLTPEVKQFLATGDIRRVEVIGQGTAAVAGEAVAAAFQRVLEDTDIAVRAITATELSGFGTREDMSDTLVVAISQSGTTTDTNRTVDILRARGAVVLAIVNRRGSDLCDKADGVLFTADGRDVEMSVASTKAFYAQIAAGWLLAIGIVESLPGAHFAEAQKQSLLHGLRELPAAMIATIAKRPEIGRAAAKHAPSRRYWAMVGNGPNFVAAREVRIKLSELCYKAIACDVTEDKKHIDLSSEPLIFVCAAGLVGSNADDVAKEVAIFRAHKAAPIVVATEGEHRFGQALEVIGVPDVHPDLAFVLSIIVGHLFGYEAALAIDASATPLREARGLIEGYVGVTGVDDWFSDFSKRIEPSARKFFDQLANGVYNGQLEASTATRLSALLRFAMGVSRFEAYQVEFGKVGTPGVVVEDLANALTAAIEELTRPVDAIKHQAKTVTVGISRSDETLLQAELIKEVLAIGTPRDALTYRTLRTLSAISPAVGESIGYTRYAIHGEVDNGATLHVSGKGGIAKGIESRVEKDPTLRGTKHRVAVEREPIVTVGSDGRVVLIIPEIKDGKAVGLTLCHVKLNPDLGAATARSVMQGYRNRYRALVDVVTESAPTFREDLLAEVSTVDLLTAPISEVAKLWQNP